jgi:hypothetical protein
MERLRVPLMVNALYFLILGAASLSASVVLALFDYTANDTGELLVLSAAFLGFGVVLWAIASDPPKHEKLVTPIITALVIFIVLLLWGLAKHVYTVLSVVPPLAINGALAVWIWSSRRQTEKAEAAGHRPAADTK